MAARVSEAERRYIVEGINANVRTDGRGALDVRHVVAQCGVIDHCNGSALVGRVHTSAKVLCGIKIQTVELLNGPDCASRVETDESFAAPAFAVNSESSARNSLANHVFFDVSIDCSALESQRETATVKHLRNFSKHGEAQVVEQLVEMLDDGRDQLLFIVPGKVAWKIFGAFSCILLSNDFLIFFVLKWT